VPAELDHPSGIRILAVRAGKELLADVPVEELPALLAQPDVNLWIDSWGTDSPVALGLARDLFHFHPLAIDDCFEAREHPKIDGFEEDYVFLITHGITAQSTPQHTETIELDAFLGRRFLFTYHERPSRSVAAVAEQVARNHGGPLRRGPAAVLHAILDRQVDSIEPVLEGLEERIEEVEARVLERPHRADLVRLLNLKRTTLGLRRWLTKQREVLLRLARNEFSLVPPQEAVLFRDVYDHVFRFTDWLETHREMITSLQETYLSVTNLRLGEIMKFLTLFTAVLMPLTVITGIYGMNFEHMPELHRPWAYPAVLLLMAAVVVVVLVFFRRRGWLGTGEVPDPPRATSEPERRSPAP
jgi:magnesium transporter